MRYWDTSALTPTLVSETRSDEIRELLGSDPSIVVWWATRIECASAIRRLEREGAPADAAQRAFDGLAELAVHWTEIAAIDPVRVAAERLLAVHPLRAADALQLAAASIWRSSSTDQTSFVCLDERLRDAAAREGFAVLPGRAGAR